MRWRSQQGPPELFPDWSHSPGEALRSATVHCGHFLSFLPAASHEAGFGKLSGDRVNLRRPPRSWLAATITELYNATGQCDPEADSATEGKPLVISKQKTAVVCGVPTQVVCTAFSSHILVVVTQLGKMGTLEPSSVTSDIGKPVLTTKVLLGKGEPLIHVFAKNLVAFVSQEAGNRAFLTLDRKDKSMVVVKALKEVIQTCQVW
ncbi:proteasome assembly chaperone 3-like [Dama dama]|uniref:proteasome assembly chaperone 3-like n=1 Tax=Dama dama TaxID=30532 RepID=UPI002A369CD9|nr:proteasome assembly chaperone 3-like [Dama dama]